MNVGQSTSNNTPVSASFLAQFAASLQNRGEGISPLTVSGYLLDLGKFAVWFRQSTAEDFRSDNVTPIDIRNYKEYLQTVKGRKPATINRHLAALRTFFTWAMQEGTATDNPVRVRNLEEPITAPRSLNERTYHHLLRAMQRYANKRDVAIVQLLRHAGLRVSELCSLQLQDVEVSERKGKVIVRSGKGRQYREIPLNLDVRRALQEYLDIRPNVADQHLFIGQRKNGLTDSAIQDMLSKYGQIAGLSHLSPHVLRHTFGRTLIDRKADLPTVQQLMGHKRIDSTVRYTKPSQQDMELAVARLETEEA